MTDNSAALYSTGNEITSLDGRYYSKISGLSQYFSEKSLNKYRVKVEIEYLVKLSDWKVIRKISRDELTFIKKLVDKFNDDDFLHLKNLEKEINHDVKAIEYFLRDKFKKTSLKDLIPFIHLGLTSEDTNNLAFGLILKDFKKSILEKDLIKLIDQLNKMSKEYIHIPMLARTHGQPAVGTTIGKELANYRFRIYKQLKRINSFKFEGKCNGAVGNNNALKTAFSEKNWLNNSQDFVKSLGLIPNLYTTQILFYDNWLEFFQMVFLVNGILIDLSINIWNYVMLTVFNQKKKENEVGSSTMPQKVNPINFEQAEGSLGLANSLFEFFERKLTLSRLQRDLSDSIIRRSFGEVFGYTILGWKNIFTGLNKLSVNEKFLKIELDSHWEILTEAIQIVLRIKNDDRGYEKMKTLVRGKTIDKQEYLKILNDLGLGNDQRLKDLTPEKYIGYAKELVNENLKLKV